MGYAPGEKETVFAAKAKNNLPGKYLLGVCGEQCDVHSMGEVSVHGVRRRSCEVKNETGQQYPGPEGFPSLCTCANHPGRKGVTGTAAEAEDSWAWLLNVKLSFPEAVKTQD